MRRREKYGIKSPHRIGRANGRLGTYPITTEGRLVGAVLMVMGIALFGTFTGYLAGLFVEESHEHHEHDQRIQELITEVRLLPEKIESREKNK